MIERIEISPKDQVTVQNLLKGRNLCEESQPEEYENKVVMKPWGYEFLVFQNEDVAIWYLRIKKGHSTSMHCHPLKKTCLIMLSGRSLCNTFRHRNYIDQGNAIIIDKSVFHSTKALSPDGIELLEIETPPNKVDLVRLSDSYGREMRSYEGLAKMQTENLSRFNHFQFSEPEENTGLTHSSNGYVIGMESYANNNDFKGRFNLKDKELFCLCRGQILTDSDESLLNVGDAYEDQEGSSSNASKLKIDAPILIMRVSRDPVFTKNKD
jgi:mannose-6-phosphate isomerase-like protein (cupin superfamily)